MSGNDRFDLDAEIDRLYQLPLDQFVQARNDLASRVRAQGDATAAMQVHSLAKPSISAWAIDQLYWRQRAAYQALMDAGGKLRAAQEASLAGRAAGVREAGRDRDSALVVALERTLAFLQEAGHAVTPALRLRVATNLDALAAYGGQPPGTTPGRLTDDLEPPGFEVFQGIRTAGGRPPRSERVPGTERKARPPGPKVVSFEAIAGARRAVADAERTASEKRSAAHRADAALEQAREDVKAARREADRAKAAFEAARDRVEQAERRVPEREKQAEQARRAADEAEESSARARKALEEVRRKKQ